MNHTIKGIIIVAAITSMLVVGTTTVPVMQNSFASKKHDFKKGERDTDKNINLNANRADSSSTSDATAENTNNIDNTATASQSQEQSACAVAVTCPEGTTTVTVGPPSPPPADPCPHSPYTDFTGGVCQNDAPKLTCNPNLTPAQITVSGPDANGKCTGTFSNNDIANARACTAAGGTYIVMSKTCSGYSATQTCPPPEGSTQTPTVVNGRCTIAPEGG
jgi:Sec-independent protein translocase protein TatA